MPESLARVEGDSNRWELALTVLEHEMRTPLAAALMQLTVVEQAIRGAGSLEQAQAVLAGAKRQIMTLSQVLRRVMELQTRGRVEISPHVVDLGHLASELIGRLRFTNPVLWSRVEVQIADGVSGSWDSSAIEQILENLLSNALKFGKQAPVRLTIASARGGVRLVVQDNGVGISRADQGRIFGLLTRAASAQGTKGQGIGLWVVRHLVRAHGGRIRIKSREGVGSTFEIWLPRSCPGNTLRRPPIRARCRVLPRHRLNQNVSDEPTAEVDRTFRRDHLPRRRP